MKFERKMKMQAGNEIVSLLKDTNARISLGDCWLVYDEATHMWVVYQRKYGAKKVQVLCAVTDVDLYIAIDMMKREN